MNIALVSKDRPWTKKLLKKLDKYNHKITWLRELSEAEIDSINPEYVFFFHWSEKVSRRIYENYKCIVVHTGCLPQDRGGSPIQNQILKDKYISRVNLIEMCEELDSGGIFCSEQISLQGDINDIWSCIADVSADLIDKLISSDLEPIPQTGDQLTNKRVQSNLINFEKCIDSVYNQIRMVDSDFYPNGYIIFNDFKLEFSRAKLQKEEILVDVRITKKQ